MKGIRLSGAPLYLDMQATTPLDPRVLDAMLPYMTELYGNPHSRTHMYGWESEDAVETARKQVRPLPRLRPAGPGLDFFLQTAAVAVPVVAAALQRQGIAAETLAAA